MKSFVFLFLCVVPYFLTVSANWIFISIPAIVTVGVPTQAILSPQSPSDRNFTPYLSQLRPGMDQNDVNNFSTNFSNPLHPDPHTGKVEFTVEVAGAYIIKIWDFSQGSGKPVPGQNSVVMNAVLSSTSTNPSNQPSPSTNSYTTDETTTSNAPVKSPSSDSSTSSDSSNIKTILIAVLVSVSVVVISAALIFVFWYRARNLKKQQQLMSSAGSEVSSPFYGERMIRKNYDSGSYNNMHTIPDLRFSAATRTGTGPHSDVGSIKSYTVASESMFYGGSVTIAPSDSISQVGYQGRFKKIDEDDDEGADEAEYRETRDRNSDRGRDEESFRSPSVQPEDRWRSSREISGPGMQEYARHHSQSSPVRNLPPLPQSYRP